MMIDMDASLAGRSKANYVFLRADGLRLLLPQEELGPVQHLDGQPQPTELPGFLRYQSDEDAPLYIALSDNLQPLPHCPADRFLAATFNSGETGLHWCWTELRILIQAELQIRALPEVLLAPDSPLREYVEMEGNLVFLCSAQQLEQLLLAAQA